MKFKNLFITVSCVALALLLCAQPVFAGGDANGNCVGEGSVPDDCNVCDGGNKDKDCKGDCFGDAILDPGGACCYEQDLGCDGLCNGQSYDACGVCGGDGSSCTCERVTGQWLGDVGQVSAGQIFAPSSGTPACLTNLVNQGIQFCASRDFSHLPYGPYLLDDCVVGGFFGYNPTLTGGVNSGIPLTSSSGLICYVADGEGCSPQSFTFVVDKDCNQPSSCSRVTDSYLRWISSPISLIWEEGTDIEAVKSVAKFKLDPSNSAQWTIWKASAKTPLLVYDPQDTNRVAGAHQLFGDWSFGGQQVAALGGAGSVLPQSKPWKNGYEALATLDQNGDQIISGSELQGIKLWFDRDQNAVASADELVDIREAGVSKLYTQTNRENKETGSIFADLGFERIVDGKTVQGASVDWYGQASDSKYELLLTETLLRNAKENVEELFKKKDNIIERNPDVTISDLSLDKNVRGIWEWQALEALPDTNFKPGGFLSFRDIGTGSVTGHALTGVGFTKKAAFEGAMMQASYLEGTRKTTSAGTLVSFVSEDVDQYIETTATLVDGNLHGQTKATVVLDNGKHESLTYHWKAKRIAAMDAKQLEAQLANKK